MCSVLVRLPRCVEETNKGRIPARNRTGSSVDERDRVNMTSSQARYNTVYTVLSAVHRKCTYGSDYQIKTCSSGSDFSTGKQLRASHRPLVQNALQRIIFPSTFELAELPSSLIVNQTAETVTTPLHKSSSRCFGCLPAAYFCRHCFLDTICSYMPPSSELE